MRNLRVLVIIIVIVYIIGIIAFAVRSASIGETTFTYPTPTSEQVAVSFDLRGFNADQQELTTSVWVEPGSALVDEDERLINPIWITIGAVNSERVLTFETGDLLEAQELVMFLPGTLENYPFDSYGDQIQVSAYQSVNDQWQDLDAVVGVDATTLPEWRHLGPIGAQTETLGSPATFELGVDRTDSTRIFALMVTGLAVLSAYIAVTLVRHVDSGRRRLDLNLTSVFVALLFAMTPIRFALPGSPPIGIWLDALVFFWAIMALMLSLLWWIKLWLNFGPQGRVFDQAAS
jgi:hypothetical protein